MRVFPLVLLSLSLFMHSPAFCQGPGTVLDVVGTATIPLKVSLRPTAGRRSEPPTSNTQGKVAVIRAQGRIELYDDKPFHVHAMLPGRISQDKVVVGKYFRKGEMLALMESAELVKQSADYLTRLEQLETSIRQNESSGRLAQANLERIRKLVKEGITPEKDLRPAEEEVRTVGEILEDLNEQRIRLENESKTLTKMYGIESLSIKHETAPSELPLRAPNSGVVVTKNVTLGDRVNPDEAAYVMTDISKVNLSIVLNMADRARITPGQHVTFLCDQLSKKSFSGRIDVVTAAKDPLSQNFSVSVILENPQALLRPGMTGQAKISVESVN